MELGTDKISRVGDHPRSYPPSSEFRPNFILPFTSPVSLLLRFVLVTFHFHKRSLSQIVPTYIPLYHALVTSTSHHGLLHFGDALGTRIMWRKRKNSSASLSSDKYKKKRRKNTHPVIPSDEENDSKSSALAEDEWYINCILDETESQYLIDWEGPWSPSWVS